MTTHNSLLSQLPITHMMLTCTATTILTAWALLHGYHQSILYSYLLIGLLILLSKKYAQLIILLACALFSLQIFFKIQSIHQSYHGNQQFLNIETILRATILQKQTAQLDKDQTTLLIESNNIYHKKAGTLKEPLKILLILPTKRAYRLQEGQTITVFKAKLQQPTPASSYQTYLIKEGVWANAFITSENIQITNNSNRSWFYWCSTHFATFLQTSTINLFNPLFLGKREKTIDTVTIQHQSIYWGIAHHMARSGVHLVALFGLFMSLFHYARIRHFYRYLICAILVYGYFEISIPSVSFLRAFCMILFQIISKINNFQYSSVHAFTLTTLLMVLHNPWYILFLDFQLSFGITAVIIWLFQAKWAKTVAFEPKTLVPS